MAGVATAERSPVTPEEVWATLDRVAKYHEESAKRQEEFDRRQKEFDRRWEENERRWEREAAIRKEEEAKRREEREEEEAKRREEDAKRREEDAKRREEEAEWRKKGLEDQADLRAKFAETGLLITRNEERVGRLRNSFGELAEHLVAPGIVGRFAEIGYRFDKIKAQRLRIPGSKKGQILTEVDILLENDDTVIAVEVKSRPQMGESENERDDIQRHIWRLEVLRRYRKDKGKPAKKILGAIAGAIFDEPVKEAALKAGFFVIGQSGDTMKIEIPKDFKPREW